MGFIVILSVTHLPRLIFVRHAMANENQAR